MLLAHFECLWAHVSEVELECTRERQDSDIHLQRTNAAVTEKIFPNNSTAVSFPHVKIPEEIHTQARNFARRDPSFIADCTSTCSSTHTTA